MESLKLNLLTLPIWWYTTGAGIVIAWMKRQFRLGLSRTGLLLFARHIREPLFGDYTKSGIVVGFILRLVLLGFKLAVFALHMAVVCAVFFLYILILPASLVMIIYQLVPR